MDKGSEQGPDVLATPLALELPKTTGSSTLEHSAITNLASEFKRMREPKLQKLKGGNTTSAQLFFRGWLKEVKVTIMDRLLSDSEGVQLIRDFTKGKAHQQVDFLDLNSTPSYHELLEHLVTAFTSGEDEATIKSEFYSRKQLAKELEDDFAEALQLLARHIFTVNKNFQSKCNEALKNQFANGLRDDIIHPLAKDLISRKPGLSFVVFRSEVANLSMSRSKRTLKVTSNRVDGEEEDEVPSKKQKADNSINTQIRALVESNKSLASSIQQFKEVHTHAITEAVTQAVGFQGQS